MHPATLFTFFFSYPLPPLRSPARRTIPFPNQAAPSLTDPFSLPHVGALLENALLQDGVEEVHDWVQTLAAEVVCPARDSGKAARAWT